MREIGVARERDQSSLPFDPHILREYGLSDARVEKCGGAWRVHAADEIYYVKGVPFSAQRLEQIHILLDRVSGGVQVARFVHNQFGDPFVIHESGNYYVTLSCDGKPASFERLALFLEGVETLARWHSLAHTVPGNLWFAERSDAAARIRNDLLTIDTLRARVLAKDRLAHEFDEWFLSLHEELERRLREVGERLSEVKYEGVRSYAFATGEICHGSYVRKNLLESERGTYAVIDHDHVYAGPQMAELATFLLHYLAPFLSREDVLRRTLMAYAAIRPINQAEWAVLGQLLCYPQGVMRCVEARLKNGNADEDDLVDALEDAWTASNLLSTEILPALFSATRPTRDDETLGAYSRSEKEGDKNEHEPS
ncbi:phosphotransferase [Ferroacidibacillus organovorans]|uniref:Aminoglycoside phosphotransferase domain-containing protein n=1 Tax=Ferroacidibacillus organovorans TaxID=1765683 RepID=A0A853KBX5_9BACL|nr:phosphotransferase [Ferroacidibacillus organovorans]KYP80709.1 hypothetical protein AYJ22_10120 [Ferroacidibacillus organovorans]OAG93951.1 hypothetical protein AYW79_07950 [Ferroacidibacillus organovorans]